METHLRDPQPAETLPLAETALATEEGETQTERFTPFLPGFLPAPTPYALPSPFTEDLRGYTEIASGAATR